MKRIFIALAIMLVVGVVFTVTSCVQFIAEHQSFRRSFHALRLGQSLDEVRRALPRFHVVGRDQVFEALWWHGQQVPEPAGEVVILNYRYSNLLYNSDYYLVFDQRGLIGLREAP